MVSWVEPTKIPPEFLTLEWVQDSRFKIQDPTRILTRFRRKTSQLVELSVGNGGTAAAVTTPTEPPLNCQRYMELLGVGVGPNGVAWSSIAAPPT